MDLSEPELSLVAAVAGGEKAWSSIEELVKAGHAEETLAGLLADPNKNRNILVRWEHPEDGTCVTLTPWGAFVWARLKDENLELGERPATIKREKRTSKIPLTDRQQQAEAELRAFTSRVPYWIEGNPGDVPAGKRNRLKESRGPLPELVRAREPEFMMDEATDEEVELFTKLFDGTKVQGIKVRIDPKLKGANKGSQGKAKRREAG